MSETVLPFPLLGWLLFMIMGPIGLIPMFASATSGMETGTKLRTAVSASALAFLTLTIAVFAGASAMERVGTSRTSLIVAAGLILTLSSLRSILGSSGCQKSQFREQSVSPSLALIPIAIPGIVSPIAVAVLVIFVSYFPAAQDRFLILGLVTVVIAIDLLALIMADRFMRLIGLAPLIVLGAVFGVLQVALGIEMLVSGLAMAKVPS